MKDPIAWMQAQAHAPDGTERGDLIRASALTAMRVCMAACASAGKDGTSEQVFMKIVSAFGDEALNAIEDGMDLEPMARA